MNAPILPFDTDHPEFRRGVECGQAWQLLKVYPQPFEVLVHADAIEMMLRMSEVTGRTCRSVDVNEEFVRVMFGERPAVTSEDPNGT